MRSSSAGATATLGLTASYCQRYLKERVEVFGSVVATALEEYCDTRICAGYDGAEAAAALDQSPPIPVDPGGVVVMPHGG